MAFTDMLEDIQFNFKGCLALIFSSHDGCNLANGHRVADNPDHHQYASEEPLIVSQRRNISIPDSGNGGNYEIKRSQILLEWLIFIESVTHDPAVLCEAFETGEEKPEAAQRVPGYDKAGGQSD